MEKWKAQGRLQKALLVILALSTLLFAVLYAVNGRQSGVWYGETFLRQSLTEEGETYSGRLEGRDLIFTITPDRAVTCRWGEAVYGPYTVTYDAAAAPQDHELAQYYTGVQVREGEKRLFRGGWGGGQGGGRVSVPLLVSEDGEVPSPLTAKAGWPAFDGLEPVTVLRLVEGMELTRRGGALPFLPGLLMTALAAGSIRFADGLFRLRMAFRVRDPEGVEPSEWELFGRGMSQVVLTVMALGTYIMGLYIKG